MKFNLGFLTGFLKKKKKKEEGAAEDEGGEGAPEKEAEKKEEAAPAAEGGEKKEGEGGEGGEGIETASDEQAKKKKKLIIIGAAAAAVLLLGGGGAFFALSGGDTATEEGAEGEAGHEGEGGEEGKEASAPVFYEMPQILVNLNTGGKQASFIKATITLELVSAADVPAVEANLPRLTDAYNTYLRELRASDLYGTAGAYRLRTEMLIRANKVLAPVKVKDVLFKELLVQ